MGVSDGEEEEGGGRERHNTSTPAATRCFGDVDRLCRGRAALITFMVQ